MKRRAFLQVATAAASAAWMPFGATASAGQGRVAFVVITGIGEATPVGPLITLLDALSARHLPVTCVVDPFSAAGEKLPIKHPLQQMLSAYLLSNRGMELAAFVPRLAAKTGYFQARAAQEAQTALRSVYQTARAGQAYPGVARTLVSNPLPAPNPPEGLRAAGILNVLIPPREPGVVRSETWPDGTVRLFGGQMVDLSEIRNLTAKAAMGQPQSLFYIDAASLQRLPSAQLATAADKFAGWLMKQEIGGQFSLPRLSDLQLRDSYGYRRNAAILLNGPQEGNASAELAAELKQAGLPFTQTDQLEDLLLAGRAGFWLNTESKGQLLTPVQWSAVASGPRPVLQSTRPLAAGTAVRLFPAEGAVTGLDDEGYLRLATLNLRAPTDVSGQLSELPQTQDTIFTLQAEALKHPMTRRHVIQELLELQTARTTRFEELGAMAISLVTNGAYDIRHRRTRTLGPDARIVPSNPVSDDRETLLQDAKTAWKFFERYTHPATGLCPSSIDFTPGGGNIHAAVTMWDVGSQINALIAASKLEFIGPKQFQTAIRKLLPQIRGRLSQGRLLPQGWIRTDRHRWGNKDFDGSDAGRLLSALDCLRRFDPQLEEVLQETVSRWDLDKIILNNEIFSVTDGTLNTSYISHSAHYSARAFRRWGLDVRSPYEVFEGFSPHDGQRALLEAAAAIGPFGAEPLLLEAMELGMTAESAYLAEVLFAAQLEEYRETGEVVCVSEGPIDEPPWFTYQGLLLDRPERTWAIDTVGEELEYRNSGYWETHRVFSTKAAFLWAAYQPHELSDRMVALARSRGRTRNGFASSIYSRTGRATQHYTDINTNAVILQAISRMLEGRT